ncbi:hypothetical protein NQ315_016971 [Exocentrus adspersus]|uniref:HIT-type domain-containing protein n=1 Tax=Exocentrus adspersus TaxID=1586481 RepID=A0AAV8VYH4_9CUCU|nr:hypothetical protein NQ315_016971 [Exocentrus adspersus]
METNINFIDKAEKQDISLASISSKLGVCEVCNVNNAKYTCPRCEVKTCCLQCNKIHKFEFACNGQRDRTKFIPLNKFTNLDLSSDYRLLEEITRNVDSSRKKFGKKWIHIPKNLMKLKTAARSRRITLKFLPHKFTRHIKNSTYLHYKTQIIYWTIDWIFVNADNLKLTDTKVSENTTIGLALSKHLSEQQDGYLQEKLQFYRAADIPGLKLYLKADQRGSKKFYELDPSLTIMECLEKKVVIEYPTIHVVLKDHSCDYDIIDSDEDDAKDGNGKKIGNEVVASIVRNAEKNERLPNTKNYLFASESSDEELPSVG